MMAIAGIADAGVGELEPLPDTPSGGQLAERAFALVESQVRAATTQPDSAWASQPGAIRTYRGGELSRIYKLYSAPDLLAGSAAEAEADLPPDWDSRPAQFVDLNAPRVEMGRLRFPVADPRSDAEGFGYAATIGGVVTRAAAGADEDAMRLPMPARWLYLLKSGDCGYLDADLRFVGSAVPSEANPIVGRIAFWTDDLSCKININTAAEGSYWDVPRYDSPGERELASAMPAAGEHQRHPGHPATVCLSSVLFPGKAIGAGLSEDEVDFLWRAGNGVGTGGSRDGTVPNELAGPVFPEPEHYQPYAELGELVARGAGPDPGEVDLAEVAGRVERADFLLTTKSNSPETTSRGRPRIGLWPYQEWVEDDIYGRDTHGPMMLGEVNRWSFTRHQYGGFHYDGMRELPRLQLLSRGFSSQVNVRAGMLSEKYGAGAFSEIDSLLASAYCYSEDAYWSALWGGLAAQTQRRSICLCGRGDRHLAIAFDEEAPFPKGIGSDVAVLEIALVFSRLHASAVRLAVIAKLRAPSVGYPAQRVETYFQFGGLFNGDLRYWPPIESNLIGSPDYEPLEEMVRVDTRLPVVGGTVALVGVVLPQIYWIPEGTQSIDFAGFSGEIGWKLSPDRSGRFPHQTAAFEFPAVRLPLPDQASESIEQRLLDSAESWIDEGDVVRSMVVGHGDDRLVAGRRVVPRGTMQPHPNYFDGGEHFAHSLTTEGGVPLQGSAPGVPILSGLDFSAEHFHPMPYPVTSPAYAPLTDPSYPFEIGPDATGDFDNAVGSLPDGPYVNRAQGNPEESVDGDLRFFVGQGAQFERPTGSRFAPQRILHSPVMLGSLPTGVVANVPWRTLLFRPDPQHFGASGLPDHFFLDAFRMPVPIPDARWPPLDPDVPEPKGDVFSMDGKLNLNSAMLPFTHIRRETALHALFKAERVVAIPAAASTTYKSGGGSDAWRRRIDVEETLKQWRRKFASGDIFRAASEICEQYLVPVGEPLGDPDESGDYPDMRAFWHEHRLTGDNTKERPYAGLYQNAATRSNAFEIHAVVEPIRKAPGSPPDRFDPATDVGSGVSAFRATLRRAISPQTEIPDYITDPGAASLERYYDYHVAAAASGGGAVDAGLRIVDVKRGESGELRVVFRAEVPGDYALQRSQGGGWENVLEARFLSAPGQRSIVDREPPPGGALYRMVRMGGAGAGG